MPGAGGKHSLLKSLLEFLKRRFGRKPPQSPADPHSYVMAPLSRGPAGRSGAAVAEPEDDSFRTFPPRRA
jgi:hypothetical protein